MCVCVCVSMCFFPNICLLFNHGNRVKNNIVYIKTLLNHATENGSQAEFWSSLKNNEPDKGLLDT